MPKIEQEATDRFIRLKELIKIVGYSSTSIWRRSNDGSFPKAVKLGPRAVAWRQSEIEEWMNSRKPIK